MSYMKYNLDYYKEELDNKIISEEYSEVLEKVEKYKGTDFSKTLDKNSKIKNVLALSEIRENILNWYEFSKDCEILEMNANYGEITGTLCEKAKRVTSIESSYKNSQIIKRRYEQRDNLELIVGNLEQIEIENKFDYIVIIGIAETLEEYIKFAKQHLKENGKILIAVNNKFGVKSWITSKEEAKVVNNNKTAISKNKLEEILKEMDYRFYYPLPDYKLPNIIYTDKSLPTLSNIYRDLTYKDENVNFKEVEAFKEIIINDVNDFKKFANSFLVETTMGKLENNKIKFITFSNIRKDEYRIKTIIKETKVYKTAINKKSENHIRLIKENIDLLRKLGINILDTYKNEEIISNYTKTDTLEKKLIDIYNQNGKEAVLNEIEKYLEFIKEKLEVTNQKNIKIFKKYKIEIDEQKIQKMNFVKHGFWDLIFQNCFIIDNEYYFYDQEWYEENIPVEYILYRAVVYFAEMKRYISDNEIFERFDISEFVTYFKQLDDKIQEEIRKPLVWNIHTKEELVKNKYKKLKKQLEEKDIEIQNLKNNNIEKNNEILIMKSSLSWKITKPLRIIRRATNKKQ